MAQMMIDTDGRTVEAPLSDVLGIVYRTTVEIATAAGLGDDIADVMAQKMTTRAEAKLAQHGYVVRQVKDR